MPPRKAGPLTSTSHPFSIAISFTGHVKSVIQVESSRLLERTFAPGTCGITGAEEFRWLRVVEPSEAITLYAEQR